MTIIDRRCFFNTVFWVWFNVDILFFTWVVCGWPIISEYVMTHSYSCYYIFESFEPFRSFDTAKYEYILCLNQ